MAYVLLPESALILIVARGIGSAMVCAFTLNEPATSLRMQSYTEILLQTSIAKSITGLFFRLLLFS